MHKFFQTAPKFPSTVGTTSGSTSGISTARSRPNERDDLSTKQSRIEIDLSNLQSDPGLRQSIKSLHPNDVEQIRRAYWEKGPCQPKQHDFPFTQFSNKGRRFNPAWFSEFGSWLEYSIAKDAAYCLCCYLFKQDIGEQSGGDYFVSIGYNNWRKKGGLSKHVGGHGSSHSQAFLKCLDLANQKQHIENVFVRQSDQTRTDYRVRLGASVDTTRFILKQGIAFRGHDESEESSNRGNFLELLQWLADHREDISNVVLQNAPENNKLTSPDIQKDIVNSCASGINVVGASCKRSDALRERKAKEVIEALSNGYLTSGRGLNQETTLARPCDTRWGSHYATLSSLIYMYSAVIDVLQGVRDYGKDAKQVGEARGLLFLMDQFDFVFNLHLMKVVLAITNELSQALQRKDQDIVNAMNLVVISKSRLQMMREDGWDSLLREVTLFCVKHDLHIPDMNDDYLVSGRSRRGGQEISNLHHYQVQLFYTVLDMQLQELNSRFNEGNTELLLCMACLSPDNQFSAFDKNKLIRLANLYPKDFSELQRTMFLSDQLDTYIYDVRFSDDFVGLSGLGKLASKMVQTRRNVVYPLVYRLLKLALVLPVATATVERVFSAMKIVKNRLRNRIGDQFLNDSLVVYIEKDISLSISNEVIMQNFQKMRNRRLQL